MTKASKSSPIRLLRWSHSLGFISHLRGVGTPVERYLGKQGLPTLCEDPNAFLPVLKIWAFWDAVAKAEDPLLGWHVGHIHGDKLLSPGILQKLEHAPTLYLALQAFLHLVGTEASHLKLGILERRHEVLFYTHYPDLKGAPGYEMSQSYQLELYLALVRHYLGRHWTPDTIGIEAPAAPAGLAKKFPGTTILVGCKVGFLSIPRSCLHLPAAPRRAGEKAMEANSGSLVRVDEFDEIKTLQTLLRAYLAEGYPSAKLAASLMDTSVRTLARRLSARGLTYSMLVDQVRFQAATELLADPGLKVAEISGAIGFDDPSHFTRLFRRVGGLTPLQFRKVKAGH